MTRKKKEGRMERGDAANRKVNRFNSKTSLSKNEKCSKEGTHTLLPIALSHHSRPTTIPILKHSKSRNRLSSLPMLNSLAFLMSCGFSVAWMPKDNFIRPRDVEGK